MATVGEAGPRHAPRAPVPPAPGMSGSSPRIETRPASFLDPFERLFASAKRLAGNYAHLAVLDLRRASMQLAWVIAAAVFISVLLVTAWLALVVALAVVLLGKGLSWPGVLCAAAGLNVLGALIVVWRVKHIFDIAPFSATLKAIKAHDAEEKQAGGAKT